MTAPKSPQPSKFILQDSTPTVVLRHTLPDGSYHFDWMIEHTGIPTEHRLITLRCSGSPTELQSQMAIKIQNHRAIYLTYEGEISGGRGKVKRVSQGRAILNPKPTDSGEFSHHIEAFVKWEHNPMELVHYHFDEAADKQWMIQRR